MIENDIKYMYNYKACIKEEAYDGKIFTKLGYLCLLPIMAFHSFSQKYEYFLPPQQELYLWVNICLL